MTANQNELRVPRQLLRHFLAKTLPLGGHQNDRRFGADPRNGLQGPVDRFNLHDHPAASAVRGVVGHAMFVPGMVADVVQMDRNQPAFRGLFQKAATQRRGEHLRKDGQNIEPDHEPISPFSNRTTITPRSLSILRTTSSMAGSRISRLPSRHTYTSLLPVGNTASIRPRSRPSSVTT